MIRSKGRISFRQYLPLKPIKGGYKMWVRANESGFVSQFQIYTGKATDGSSEQNLGQRVVTDLTKTSRIVYRQFLQFSYNYHCKKIGYISVLDKLKRNFQNTWVTSKLLQLNISLGLALYKTISDFAFPPTLLAGKSQLKLKINRWHHGGILLI